mmetsp:Transcript_49995/g.122041  ORF Transcript_49995/g.122041 Transcript_49995/m.122041 type:complete len:195 (+) Transcript_49995:37-621(+)
MDKVPFEHLMGGGENRVLSSVRHGQRLHAFGLQCNVQDALRLYALAKDELINPPAAPSPMKKKAGGSRAATGLPKPRRRRDPLPGRIWVSIVQKSGGECEREGGEAEATLCVSGNKEFDPIQIKAGPEMTAGELKRKILARVASAVKSPQCQLEHLRLACPAGMFVEEQTLGDWDVRQDEFIFCFVAPPKVQCR